MFIRVGHIINTASILLLAARADPIPHQYVLNSPHASALKTGQLWRFDVANGSEGALEEVLSLAEEHNLDLWQVARSHIDIYSPLYSLELPEPIKALPHSLVANVSTPERSRVTTPNPGEWNLSSLKRTAYHSEYHPLYEIESFMRELQSTRPDLVKIQDLGHSGSGREMYGLAISKPNISGKKSDMKGRKQPRRSDEKLSFVIVGAQHAREWIATSTALYLSHALIANETETYSLSYLLDLFDFYIVPVPNPDGHDYTWETDRFWYKTRQKMGPKGRCYGLDMNRNWGYKWHPHVLSRYNTLPRPARPVDPCSHWFPGHRPFEAPEVNNIANWVTTIPNAVGFIDLRSYGQMLSYPFSHSCGAIPKDAEDQIEAALGAARAMEGEHGVKYATGSLCEMLYRAPGNIVDWMYKRMKIKYSYALHLRDTGTHGFVLPSTWIRPVGEETGEMLVYLAKFIADKLQREL